MKRNLLIVILLYVVMTPLLVGCYSPEKEALENSTKNFNYAVEEFTITQAYLEEKIAECDRLLSATTIEDVSDPKRLDMLYMQITASKDMDFFIPEIAASSAEVDLQIQEIKLRCNEMQEQRILLSSLIVSVEASAEIQTYIIEAEEMAEKLSMAAPKNAYTGQDGIKIVVDGSEIIPEDSDVGVAAPFIVDGTIYLPVHTVATALGKELYWDGPNYTVYLGDMNGELEYPSLKIENATNIGSSTYVNPNLTDNYGNRYASAIYDFRGFQTLLNMKYSRFKGTVYVPYGYRGGFYGDLTATFNIEADGKVIYTSPVMSKTSQPVSFDVDIRGCNNFRLTLGSGSSYEVIRLGDAGFYQ